MIDMTVSSILLLLLSSLSFPYSSSSSSTLDSGFSLSVDKPEDVLVSPDGTFSAGFYVIGENACVFAIWFTRLPQSSPNSAVVWTANRNQPVNGKRSTLSLLRTGNLVLSDAAQRNVWSSETTSSWPTRLTLNDNGNLVLSEIHSEETIILWQSFDFPTDTLLGGQQLKKHTQLVSARSNTNISSGFYKLFFDTDNVLRLLYDTADISSVYWPPPYLTSFEAGRSTYNSSRIAVLDSFGSFISTDQFKFTTSDHGAFMQRRLKIDPDGNIRVYSLQQNNQWYVSWQAIPDSCIVHGICGVNSICKYNPRKGRTCSCLPGYRVKNHSDWSYGCESKFQHTCDSNFLKFPHVEFYGNDYVYVKNTSYKNCRDLCLQDCECKVFQFTFEENSVFTCYIKRILINGRHSPTFLGTSYIRLPQNKSNSNSNSFFEEEESDHDNGQVCFVKLERAYASGHVNSFVKFFLWFSIAVGALEVLCICLIWCSLDRTKQNSKANQQGYNFLSPFGFRKFTYSELKTATKGFKEEIGRGAGGIVYKGVLSDRRVAAIKKLNDTNVGAKQEEAEFRAEMTIIGRLNHMNLIEMWGYCAEGKHRLLVYEFMENGSLAQNLKSNTLDWTKRYNIALGTARVLAYLHEECLEWILHCDIKPQNILLDSKYQPKVADFGLSKLLNRSDQNTQSFSMIRGTRGYMAPEWIFNLPITSKVDVYSYGIVVLEMITGRSPMAMASLSEEGEEAMNGRLVPWAREKRKKTTSDRKGSSWVAQIMDPAIASNFEIEMRKIETLASVALKCVEDDKDERPTMSQVVEMLRSHEEEAS
ncbi:putative receptor protein kinase ZmPK1 [Prosopis cineraria]|uniref:putative receptor protein kinase ZmPK1 n=1 Tax=Prosopis cineraria TaxID=364024 RepID=UPI0024105BA7|nr:putative receptor protein kinase ZmPK1 [Prosopis cineraria]